MLCFVAGIMAAALPAETGTAVIVNSGSTNSPGFRIVVERPGTADYTQTRGRASTVKGHIPPELAKRFFTDLEAGKPLADLPHRTCMKSASFGTTLTVEFSGETTPDLNCKSGAGPKLQSLMNDVNEIVKAVQPPR